MEGYFRDPGFDQLRTDYAGFRKRDLNATWEEGFIKICARDDSDTPSSGKCDSSRRAFSCVSYQLSKLYTK